MFLPSNAYNPHQPIADWIIATTAITDNNIFVDVLSIKNTIINNIIPSINLATRSIFPIFFFIIILYHFNYKDISIAPSTIAIAPILFNIVRDSLKNNTDNISTKTMLVLSMAATAVTGPVFMAKK